MFTEFEQQLVNALQINPRASWTDLGEILQVDPVTVARHWTALESSGRSWINVDAGDQVPTGPWLTVFATLDCVTGYVHAIAERLADEGLVFGIDHISGRSDLLVSIAIPDLATLSDYLMVDLAGVDGVRHVNVFVTTKIVRQGHHWRVRALSPDQEHQVRVTLPAAGTARPLGASDEPLLGAVLSNPRVSYTVLAQAMGVSASTARRRLNALLAAGQLTMRCEIAQSLSGWPVSTLIRCHVRPARLSAAMHQLAGLPEARLCASVTGTDANLLLGAWLRSVADLERLEYALHDQVDDLRVVDRALVLRHVKRAGRVLDRQGRPIRRVPIRW